MSAARAVDRLHRRFRSALVALLLLAGAWGVIGCDPSRDEVGSAGTQAPTPTPTAAALTHTPRVEVPTPTPTVAPPNSHIDCRPGNVDTRTYRRCVNAHAECRDSDVVDGHAYANAIGGATHAHAHAAVGSADACRANPNPACGVQGA